MTGLPEGWMMTTIEDATLSVSMIKQSNTDEREIRYIDISSIDNQSNRIAEPKQLRLSEAPSRARQIVKTGDVVFSTVRPYLRNIAAVPAALDGEIASTGFAVLRPAEFVAPAFLFYKAISRDFVGALTGEQYGMSYPAVKEEQVRSQPFELPPLPEQHRIVAKIEELFSELDAGTASLTRARAQLKTYRQALLDAATDGRLLTWLGERNEAYHKADMVQLNDLINDIGQGWSPNCHNHASPNEETWAVMKTTAIQHLSFNDQENKELPAGNPPREHLELRAGDLLITRAGPRTRVGVACLVRAVRPRLLLCDKAYRLRVIADRMLPEYLELVLNAPRVLWEIEKIKSGISDSGLNLTQSKFLALMVHLPSLDEQRKTLNHLSEVLSNTDRLDSEITAALTRVTALRQSILKKAFSGQLVPQVPADEPASALLARLAQAPAPKPRRKTKP